MSINLAFCHHQHKYSVVCFLWWFLIEMAENGWCRKLVLGNGCAAWFAEIAGWGPGRTLKAAEQKDAGGGRTGLGHTDDEERQRHTKLHTQGN